MGTNEDNGRHTAIGHEPSAFEFRNKLFYFYGYPSSSEKGIDSPDAQGEELRRRYRARLKMEDGLTRLGARIAASSEESRSADDFVVVPDGVVSLAEKPHHPGFLINETRLLKNLPGIVVP
ncbi:hypothetical protein LPJ59_001025 [Coemansia sp. RSA 2399]|nr:hypothetical protein LPJ59_001025 [Coemansia sp. RSA 2399]